MAGIGPVPDAVGCPVRITRQTQTPPVTARRTLPNWAAPTSRRKSRRPTTSAGAKPAPSVTANNSGSNASAKPTTTRGRTSSVSLAKMRTIRRTRGRGTAPSSESGATVSGATARAACLVILGQGTSRVAGVSRRASPASRTRARRLGTAAVRRLGKKVAR